MTISGGSDSSASGNPSASDRSVQAGKAGGSALDTPRPPPALLSVSDLGCSAGVRPLFSGLSFDLQSGNWLRLAGPNGSGKSTLLRAISGLLRPSSGAVLWRDRPRRPDSPAWRGAMLYQGHASGWKDILTATENLLLQLTLDRGIRPGNNEVADCLAEVGLARQARLAFQRLSAGQRHRLSLARLAIAHQTLWLLDEPTTALDADGQQLFGSILDRHLRKGGCALVATHLPIDCETPSHQIDLARFSARK
jgi:heme exporter protein A